MTVEQIMDRFDSIFKIANQPPLKPESRGTIQEGVEEVLRENNYTGTEDEIWNKVFTEVLSRSLDAVIKNVPKEKI